jgi:hypothetical protein
MQIRRTLSCTALAVRNQRCIIALCAGSRGRHLQFIVYEAKSQCGGDISGASAKGHAFVVHRVVHVNYATADLSEGVLCLTPVANSSRFQLLTILFLPSLPETVCPAAITAFL